MRVQEIHLESCIKKIGVPSDSNRITHSGCNKTCRLIEACEREYEWVEKGI